MYLEPVKVTAFESTTQTKQKPQEVDQLRTGVSAPSVATKYPPSGQVVGTLQELNATKSKLDKPIKTNCIASDFLSILPTVMQIVPTIKQDLHVSLDVNRWSQAVLSFSNRVFNEIQSLPVRKESLGLDSKLADQVVGLVSELTLEAINFVKQLEYVLLTLFIFSGTMVLFNQMGIQ